MLRKWKGLIVRLLSDRSGQDMIEYALMASFIAVAVASFIPYSVIPIMSLIYSRILSIMPTGTGS